MFTCLTSYDRAMVYRDRNKEKLPNEFSNMFYLGVIHITVNSYGIEACYSYAVVPLIKRNEEKKNFILKGNLKS